MAATDLPGARPKRRDPRSDRRQQISAVDISRAYFNAETDPAEPTYVQLPQEDRDRDRGMCGLLMKHMYGTKRAADGWQQEYSGFLRSLGFKQGVACPCVFVHPSRGLICSVHGDDFTTAGEARELDWFEDSLEAKYELKRAGRLGPGPNDKKELSVLNRILRYTPEGFEYEADPRQCERLLEEMQLDGNCNRAATPGVKPLAHQLESDTPLDDLQHTKFRGTAARANYLSADRADVQFASKEVCRFMSAPTELSLNALKRLGRYLLGARRLVYRYEWQAADQIECYSDTDWSGCGRTRRSTSGGCVMIGKHCIKTWSTTQPTVTLSSGEAEFYGVVKASGIALGQQSLLRDLDVELPVRVWTDSSAALGICSRSGLGKLRHLETHTLWVQEKIRTGAFELRKVKGDVNPADLFTKHLSSRERVHMLVTLFGCVYRDGRAESAPLLRPNFEGGSLFSSGPEGAVDEVDDDEALLLDEARVTIPDAKRHDIRRLPHEHSETEMHEFFPLIIVPPLDVNVEDWSPDPSEPFACARMSVASRPANKTGEVVASRESSR